MSTPAQGKIVRNDMRAPLKKARGLGSAKGGTGHFWWQRVTAVALVPLVIWFIFLVLGLIGQDEFVVRARLAEPFTGTLLILLVTATFWHGQMGLQVVIEDYLHNRLGFALQIAVKFLAAIGIILAALSVIRIALGS
ncbi:MAG: succinate dehydrogenase, hydrophobic membrane anchor protein [Xanthomonadales bacterium]|nr:succinate dehydrogenase, hydrophobic membrane anchor protein [Xanthomonadales bacterium]